MTKLYYTDPLKAAWMARGFGVKYGIKYNDRLVWDCVTGGGDDSWRPMAYIDVVDDIKEGSLKEAYYIHPDSLAVFEPKEGDMGIDSTGRPCEIFLNNWKLVDGLAEEYGSRPCPPVIIDKRNGKAFFAPEVEG